MTKDVELIESTALITEVAAKMAEKRVRRIPVIEKSPQGSHLAGIISKSDILHFFPPNVNPFAVNAGETFYTKMTAAEIMHRNLVTTTTDTPIEQAAELMRNRKVGSLAVMRGNALVGILTKSDIFRAFASMFAALPQSARITFDMTRGDDAYTLVSQLAAKRKVHILSLVTSKQEDRPVCVVRLNGAGLDQFLDDIWKSGHPILSVVKY